MRSMSASTAVVAVATILGILATVAYLATHGQDAAPVLAVLAPVIAGVFVASKVDGQAARINRIDENVNGKLDGRIRAAVHAVMDERDMATDGHVSETPQP